MHNQLHNTIETFSFDCAQQCACGYVAAATATAATAVAECPTTQQQQQQQLADCHAKCGPYKCYLTSHG
jgi:hypothetical protein